MPTIEPKPVIDTSKMSPAQREALELTESAREAAQTERGFAGGLFMGRFNLPQIHPFPAQSVEDGDHGDAFLQRLETFLNEHVDPDEIDRTGEIPQEIIEGLAQMGAFGIKISPQYGGLGLSQTNYCRAGIMLGSFCGNLTALISAHQSIGVPQPLILFGTEEQKRGFCPELQAARFPHSRSLKSKSAPIQRRWKRTPNRRPTARLSSSTVRNSGARMV